MVVEFYESKLFLDNYMDLKIEPIIPINIGYGEDYIIHEHLGHIVEPEKEIMYGSKVTSMEEYIS